MACPAGYLEGCDFIQALVTQLPYFDAVIMRDITLVDGWIGNVSIGTEPVGTPVESTQDRFRGVWPDVTKKWNPVAAAGIGCTGNPCDPVPNQLGWGADRITYSTHEQVWESPLMCYNQMMHITEVEAHVQQIVSEIFRPATSAISSMFLRKETLFRAGTIDTPGRLVANRSMTPFTYVWSVNPADTTEEIYFDTSAHPDSVFLLMPQMLQNMFALLMRSGYGGKQPFRDMPPLVELVTSADVGWALEKFAGASGTSSPGANWRFTQWNDAHDYWRWGYSGQIGNFAWRADELGLRFNFVTDLGGGVGANRYRYQIILPYKNVVTSGAGGAAGIGRVPNGDYDSAKFQISFISHKAGLQLLVPDGGQINPAMPFSHISFGGQWKWLNHDLGPDVDGNPITNKWGNKGQFGAWFKYKARPLHTEFLRAIFHRREQFCIPEIGNCDNTASYPPQIYSSALPTCDDLV